MNISDADLKKLWGKAAGRCSCPGCTNSCIEFLEKTGDIILGEMAHVIAQSSKGPRGHSAKAGPDTYENLILLCPHHHGMVDKAPKDFSEKLLHEWKQNHESEIERALTGPQFSDAKSLFNFAQKLLIENKAIHDRFGPNSETAKANPLSEGAILWSLRKCEAILPNNRRIINAFIKNKEHLSNDQWKIFVDFQEHALAFERNTYKRMDRDSSPQFPLTFQEMLVSYAK